MNFRGLTGLSRAAAVTGAFLLASSAANATVLNVTNVQLAGPADATGSYTSGGYYTGDVGGEYVYDVGLVYTINGKTYFVNCDDIFHNISTGDHFTAQAVNFSDDSHPYDFDPNAPGDGKSPDYTKGQIAEMTWLLDQGTAIWNAGGGTANTGGATETLDLAALQLASWEVGNPPDYFVPSSFDPTVWSTANAYLADWAGQKGYSEELISIDPAGLQSQIVDAFIPVPEPGTWTMMLLGFGLVGFAARRNGSKALRVLQAAV